MTQILMSFYILVSLITPSRALADYTLADLEVLSQEGNYEEFFKHALDVRPSERKDNWKSMVSKMGDGLTRGILIKSTIDRNQFKKVEELYRWPALKGDDLFRSRRQEIGLKFLKTCLKAETQCWDDVKQFWESDPTDPDTAFKIAELIQEFPNSPLKSWDYLAFSLKSSLSEFYCKKDFAMTSLWTKLGLDYIRLGNQGDFLKKIDQTVHPDCLPSLNLKARKQLLKPDDVNDRELAFQILKSQGKADEVTTDFFFTVYLLERPSQGELFNYAWNRLGELNRKSSRRDRVLKILKALDPLPDEILSSMDQTKKRVILSHFKQNFPEYLDHYSNQCLHFYGGTMVFPQGNPTIRCQELMQADFAGQLLGSEQIKKFQEIRKI